MARRRKSLGKSAAPIDWVIYEYLRKVTNLAVSYSKEKIPSQTLQDAVKTEIDMKVEGNPFIDRGSMYLDYYWAVYLHDGRDYVRPDTKVFLVWFSNPRHDPRLGYSRLRYPKQKENVRRLTPQQFKKGLERNKKVIARRKAEGIKGDDLYYNLPMIVTKLSGPTKSYRSGHKHPSEFWSNSVGMLGFPEIALDILKKDVHEYIWNVLPTWKG